jgi:hypothetical protein
VDDNRLVVLDRLSDVLDDFSHATEGLVLILSQPTSLPLASRCRDSASLVRAIDDDGLRLLRVSSLLMWQWRYAQGLIGSHGELTDGDTTNKDGVPLMVILDEIFEELGFLGVILNKDGKEDC